MSKNPSLTGAVKGDHSGRFDPLIYSVSKLRLPDHLIEITANTPARIDIEASCRLFDNGDIAFPDLRGLNKRINDLRRKYLVVLGHDYGSVILRRQLPDFESDLRQLQEELREIVGHLETRVGAQIEKAKVRTIEALKPLIFANPPDWLLGLPEDTVLDRIRRTLDECFPQPNDITQEVSVTCTRKDITWEMLNEGEFREEIKRLFPEEGFAKLYDETAALPEGRETRSQEFPDDVLWPEQIG